MDRDTQTRLVRVAKAAEAEAFLQGSESEEHLQRGFDEGYARAFPLAMDVGTALGRRCAECGVGVDELSRVLREGLVKIMDRANKRGTKVKGSEGLLPRQPDIGDVDGDDDGDNWLYNDEDDDGEVHTPAPGRDKGKSDDGEGGDDTAIEVEEEDLTGELYSYVMANLELEVETNT